MNIIFITAQVNEKIFVLIRTFENSNAGGLARYATSANGCKTSSSVITDPVETRYIDIAVVQQY